MKLEPRSRPTPWPIQTNPTTANPNATIQRVRNGTSPVAS